MRQNENISKEKDEILEKCFQQESDNLALQRREEKTQKETKEWRLKYRAAEMDYILAQKDIHDIKEVNAFMVEELRLNSREIASLQKQQEREEKDDGRASSTESSNRLEKEQAATSSGSCNRTDKKQTATSRASCNRIEEEQAVTTSEISNKPEIEQASTSTGSRNKLDKEQAATYSGIRPGIDKEQAVTSSGSVNRLEREQTATFCEKEQAATFSGRETTRARGTKTTDPATGYTGKYVGIDYIAKYARRMQNEEKIKAKSLSSPKTSQKKASAKWAAFDIVIEDEKQNMQNVTMSKNVRNHKNREQPEASSKRSSREPSSNKSSEHVRTSTDVSDRMESGSPISSSEIKTQIDDKCKGVRLIKDVAKQRINSITSSKSSQKSTSGKWAAFDVVLDGRTQMVENFVVSKIVHNLKKDAQPTSSNQRPSRRAANISPSEQSNTQIETSDEWVASKGTSRVGKIKNQNSVKIGDRSETCNGSSSARGKYVAESFQIQWADKYTAFEIPNGNQGSTKRFSTQRIQVQSSRKADPSATTNRDSVRQAKNITPPQVASIKRKSTSHESRTGSISPSVSASKTRFPPISKRTNLIVKTSSDTSADSPTNDDSNYLITGAAMKSLTEGKKKKDGGVAWYNKIEKSIRSLAAIVSSSAARLPKINERRASILGKSRSSGTFTPSKISGTKRFRSRKVAPLNIDVSTNGTSEIVYNGTFES